VFEIDLQRGVAHAAAAGSTIADTARSFMPIGVGLVLLAAVLWATGASLDRSIAKREKIAVELEQAVEANRVQLAEVSGKRRAMLGVQQQELYWSDQLRLFSRKIPDKIWLSRIAVETAAAPPVAAGQRAAAPPPGRRLRIEGGVLSHSQEANLDLVGKFIETIQAEPRFQQSFTGLTLHSVRRDGGDPYSLLFELNANFKS